MLKTILASPRDDCGASARTHIGIGGTKNTNATPGSSNTKPSGRLWKSFKGSLRGQGSAKAGLEIFSKSPHVTLNDVSINAHAADRLEIHYHNADPATGIKLHEALRRLPDPQRCHYDVMRVCSKGTRVVHLEEISSWATRSVDSSVSSEHAERVLVVGGPAGSGKSALAHTICKGMYDSGLLVASFFSHTNQQLTSEDFMAVFIRGLCSINPQIEQGIGRLIVENPGLASSPAITQFEGLVIPIIPLLPTDRMFVVGIDALDEQADKVLVAFLRDYVPRLPATFKFILTTRPVPQVMEHLEGQPHIHIFPRLLAGGSSFQDVRTYAQLQLSKTNYHGRVSPKLLDEFIVKSEGLFLWAETVLNHIDNSYDPPAELADIVKGASSHWLESETSTKKLESLYAHILSKLHWTDRRFVEKYNVVMGALVTLMEPLSVSGMAALYAPDGVTEEDIHRICSFIRPLIQDYSRDTPQKPVQLLHLSVQEFLTRSAPPPYHIDLSVHHLFLSRLSLLTIKEMLVPTNVPTLGYTEGDWVWDFTEAPPGIPRLAKEVVVEHLWYACRQLGQHELSASKDFVDKSHGALLYEIVVENPRYLLEASASMGTLVDIVSLRKKAVKLHSADCTSENTRMTMKAYCAMAACLYPQDISLGLMEESVRLYQQSIPSSSDPSMELEYATGLFRLARLLYARLRSREGLVIAEEALTVIRPLTSTSDSLASPALGYALLIQIRILDRLNRHEECHRLDVRAIDTFRELEAAQPGTFRVHLAMALSLTASTLMERQRHCEAITYLEESTKLRRLLVASTPDKHESFLADVLIQHGICYAQVGRATEAVALAEEAVMIRRRLVEKDPSHFSPYLAYTLYLLAWCLDKCGQHSDAVPPSLESLKMRRKLAEADPAAYESALSGSLHSHALYLSKSPTTLAESIKYGQEAVEIRRRLACKDPQSFDANLARSLFNLACNLGKFSRYSEAVPIAKECVDIRRRLVKGDPAAHEPSLASSLHSYAIYLSQSPNTLAKSIMSSQEAVEILRRLAHQDPGSFDADLAWSLFNLADALGKSSRYSEAVPIARECVDIRRRLAEEEPTAHEPSLASSLHSYAIYLSQSPTMLAESIEPGQEAVEILRRLARHDPLRFEADLEQSLFTLAYSLDDCNRHSEAVEIAKECVDIRRRLAEGDSAAHEASLADSLHSHAMYLSKSPTTLVESSESGQEAVKIRRRLAYEDTKSFNADLALSLFNLACALGNCGRYSAAVPITKECVDIRRWLAEGDPAAHEASLADSLHRYAWYLSQSPTTLAESIEPAQEAVEIRCRLARENPQNFHVDLAWSLFDLACALGNCGRYSRAVPIIKECVDIRRRLAEVNPAAHETSLVDSLHRHAWYLSQSPSTLAESIEPAQEAVEIQRRLAREDPHSFAADLARSLFNLACALGNCGRYCRAVPIIKECVDIRRRLAEGDPATHKASLGDSLHNYALYLSKSPTTLVESIRPGQEAVDIRRRLAREDPHTFDAGLAHSLLNLAYNLGSCSRYSEAVVLAKECVEARRRLAVEDSAAHEPSLADSLHNYALYLSKSPTTLAESIEPGQEAVEIRRRLACRDPQSFDAGLAHSLFSLAYNLGSCSRYSEAVPLAKECVETRRRMARGDPAAHEASLANSLHSYALYLSKSLTTLAESIEPGQEAVDIRRRLAHRDPQSFDAGLAHSLFNLACALGNSNRYSGAVPIIKECVDIRRRLAEGNPSAHEASLADSLHKYAWYLSQSPTTLTESIEPAQEAVDIRRRLAREDPQSFDAGLAHLLLNLAHILGSCSRYSEAVPIAKECVHIRRGLAARDCATYESLLAGALNSLAWYLAQIPGRKPEAHTAAEESVNILRRLALENPKAFSDDLVASLDTMAYSFNHCGRYEDALPPVLEGLEIYRKAIEGETYEISDHNSSALHKTYVESLVGLGSNEASVPLKTAIIIYERLILSQPQVASYSLELQECRRLLERLSGGSTNSNF